MAEVYHLDLGKKDLEGATVALLPGDPARSETIVRFISGKFGGKPVFLASKREFTTHLARISGKNVVVTSTGIGGSSASIAVEELARLGIKTFIRVGTTGAIQPGISSGECIITMGSVRLDGASNHYAPIEYPAVADHLVVTALVNGAKKAGVKSHTGVTASSATFYPGEERKDSYRKYILRELRGLTGELRALNVLNFEMESATILTMTASMGLKGGCVTGVVNRASTGKITPKALKLGEDNAIRTAVYGVEWLINSGRQ